MTDTANERAREGKSTIPAVIHRLPSVTPSGYSLCFLPRIVVIQSTGHDVAPTMLRISVVLSSTGCVCVCVYVCVCTKIRVYGPLLWREEKQRSSMGVSKVKWLRNYRVLCFFDVVLTTHISTTLGFPPSLDVGSSASNPSYSPVSS